MTKFNQQLISGINVMFTLLCFVMIFIFVSENYKSLMHNGFLSVKIKSFIPLVFILIGGVLRYFCVEIIRSYSQEHGD